MSVARRRGIPVYEAQGQAHGREIPFLPVLQMMRSYFAIAESDTDQQAREKIAGRMLLLDDAFAESLPLLFDFLAVPDPHRPAPRMDPDARQRALLEMVKRLVHTSGQSNPGINLLEDAHWFDPGTEIFVTQFVEAIQGSRTLAILNFRPEYSAPWMRKSYYRQISLAPLGAEAIKALLADLLGEHPSLNGLPDLIQERTAGNPFFIEEVVRALAESGNLEGKRGDYRLVRPVDEAAVPPTVNTILAARIDRLSEREKSLLQSAAVIGREFSEPVLARAAALGDGELEPALRALIAAEFLYEQELYPEAVYAFKHPLTQEVAYRSQLGERRAAVHRRVAEALEELYPDKLDERAALLAQHWEAAGDRLAAARWSARAASWVGLNDIAEAVRHWRKVSELVEALPDSAESSALALGARVARLNYGWRLGISEQEATAHYEAGRELAERSGDRVNLLLITASYATVRGLAGHVEEYGELAEEVNRLSIEIGDPGLRMAMLTVPGLRASCSGALGRGACGPRRGGRAWRRGSRARRGDLPGLSLRMVPADERPDPGRHGVPRGGGVVTGTCFAGGPSAGRPRDRGLGTHGLRFAGAHQRADRAGARPCNPGVRACRADRLCVLADLGSLQPRVCPFHGRRDGRSDRRARALDRARPRSPHRTGERLLPGGWFVRGAAERR